MYYVCMFEWQCIWAVIATYTYIYIFSLIFYTYIYICPHLFCESVLQESEACTASAIAAQVLAVRSAKQQPLTSQRQQQRLSAER